MTSPASPGPSAAAPLVEFADVGVVSDGVVMLLEATGRAEAASALAVTGPNGAGKTTLLRVLAARTPTTTGRVLVAGRIPDERDRVFRRSLAALIERPQTARDLTIVEHLRFIGATWGGSVREASRAAYELLEEFGIEALARRYPHELSSGQSQLVSLALTLARPCQVLLLDEPEQRLDADRLGLVIDAVSRRRDAGAAVVLASHSPRFVAEVADHELHLAAGTGEEGAS